MILTVSSSRLFLGVSCSKRGVIAPQDTDSDGDVYGQRYAPSAESLGPSRLGRSESSTPTFADYGGPAGAREAYPAWSAERQIPLSKEEIEDIFLDLTQKFGFQRDSMRNMVCLPLRELLPWSMCEGESMSRNIFAIFSTYIPHSSLKVSGICVVEKIPGDITSTILDLFIVRSITICFYSKGFNDVEIQKLGFAHAIYAWICGQSYTSDQVCLAA